MLGILFCSTGFVQQDNESATESLCDIREFWKTNCISDFLNFFCENIWTKSRTSRKHVKMDDVRLYTM